MNACASGCVVSRTDRGEARQACSMLAGSRYRHDVMLAFIVFFSVVFSMFSYMQSYDYWNCCGVWFKGLKTKLSARLHRRFVCGLDT